MNVKAGTSCASRRKPRLSQTGSRRKKVSRLGAPRNREGSAACFDCGAPKSCSKHALPLFRVMRVVKQNGELDAAMTELREVGRRWIPRVQVRRGIVRWKKHQRVQEFEQGVGFVRRQANVEVM